MNELLVALGPIADVSQGMIMQAAVVFMRVTAFFALFPTIGESSLPLRVKLVTSVTFTMIAVPALQATSPTVLAPFASVENFGLGIIFGEALCGLVLGLGLRMLFFTLQIAGTIISQSMSVAQMFNGAGPEPQPIIANFLVLAGLAVFCALGGISHGVELIILSYHVFPPGGVPDVAFLAQWGVAEVARAFARGFSLASPFVIAALLYNLSLGAINRAMPSLMVTFIGAPALTMGGLILLALLLPTLLEVWRGWLEQGMSQPLGGW